MIISVGMPEIVVGWRVFVVIRKRDTGYNLIYAIAFDVPAFINAVVVYRNELLALKFHALNTERSLQ